MKLSVFLFAVLVVTAPVAARDAFSFREVNGSGLELSENGKPVFVYNYGMILKDGFPEAMRRSTYLHPVYLPDGALITDDFNKDHPHHRGISWMWPVVTVDGKTYDLWTVGGIKQSFLRWTAKNAGNGKAKLAVANGWLIGDRKVVDEKVEILIHAAKENTRVLEFTLIFEASGDPVEIAGTPDGKKGFGGFCFRFAPREGGKQGTVIRTDQGVAGQDGVMEVHPWAQVEGKFEGRPGGGRIEDLSSNPGYPNGWLMRHGFGFLNVSYPGLKPAKLVRGQPLTLRYKVILFSGAQPANGTP